MVSRVIPVDDFVLVIFGATGDLAHRKILPGLYRRFKAGQFPATRSWPSFWACWAMSPSTPRARAAGRR